MGFNYVYTPGEKKSAKCVFSYKLLYLMMDWRLLVVSHVMCCVYVLLSFDHYYVVMWL